MRHNTQLDGFNLNRASTGYNSRRQENDKLQIHLRSDSVKNKSCQSRAAITRKKNISSPRLIVITKGRRGGGERERLKQTSGLSHLFRDEEAMLELWRRRRLRERALYLQEENLERGRERAQKNRKRRNHKVSNFIAHCLYIYRGRGKTRQVTNFAGDGV